jgi:hypothetical protein
VGCDNIAGHSNHEVARAKEAELKKSIEAEPEL